MRPPTSRLAVGTPRRARPRPSPRTTRPETAYGRPSESAAARTSPRASSARSAASRATSPLARLPKRKFSPTTTARAATAPNRNPSAKPSAVTWESSWVNSSTSTSPMPAAPSSSTRSARVHSSAGASADRGDRAVPARRAEGLPGRQGDRLARGHGPHAQRGEGGRRVDHDLPEPPAIGEGLQLVQGVGVGLAEAAGGGAAQAGQVGQGAEGAAEVGRQGAHVGPAGAGHHDRRDGTLAAGQLAQLEGVDGDLAGLALDGLAAPRLRVEPLAPHLDGRDHRRDLLLDAE